MKKIYRSVFYSLSLLSILTLYIDCSGNLNSIVPTGGAASIGSPVSGPSLSPSPYPSPSVLCQNPSQSKNLANITPALIFGRDLTINNPSTVSSSFSSTFISGSAVKIYGQYEITYCLPVGSQSFSGILMYNPGTPSDQTAASNSIRVRYYVDGNQVLDATTDPYTPPQNFVAPMNGGNQLKIVADQPFTGGYIYIVNGTFSSENLPSSQNYIFDPTTQVGYAGPPLAGNTRQNMFYVFYPGETVPLSVYFSQPNVTQASLTIQLTPEYGAGANPNTNSSPTYSQPFNLTLTKNSGGNSQGTAKWVVPSWQGPAQLSILENVTLAGQSTIVYSKTHRVAIAPQTSLSDIKGSTFAVHLSSDGTLHPADDFTYLWGASLARMALRWPFVQATGQAAFDFSRADEIIKSLNNQGLQILGILNGSISGETDPAWTAALQGSSYYGAWQNYVAQAATHYNGQVKYWDLYNEINQLYYDTWIPNQSFPTGDSNADIKILQGGLSTLRSLNTNSFIVCCSTGTTSPLQYYERLLNAGGILNSVDYVSNHPYQSYAPEDLDGVFDYMGLNNALIKSFLTPTQKLWNTEANWIVGYTAPPHLAGFSEHDESEYLVRVNLRSYASGIPYFTHMPVYHYNAFPTTTNDLRYIQEDVLSSYAYMTSLFTGTSNQNLLVPDGNSQEIFGVSASRDSDGKIVGALWGSASGGTVSLNGVQGVLFFDLYGNSITVGNPISVGTSPIYFIANSGSSPQVTVVASANQPSWTNLGKIPWPVSDQTAVITPAAVSGTVAPDTNGTIHVLTGTQAAFSSEIATIAFSPMLTGQCYIATVELSVIQGSIGLKASDSSGNALFQIPISYNSDGGLHHFAQVRFIGTTGNAKIVITSYNAVPQTTEFYIFNAPTSTKISPCP